MTPFNIELLRKIENSLYNNLGKENFDEERFGKFEEESLGIKIKNKIKKLINYKFKQRIQYELDKIEKYEDELNFIWSRLNNVSQDLLVDIIAYRLLGYRKIKLPLHNNFYKESLAKAKSLKKSDNKIDPHFIRFILEHYDLNSIGHDIEIYFTAEGIVIDFIIEQYAYKLNNNYIVQAEKGDFVLDIGACWGDTALYFAEKVGDEGKVFSFEFIPDNIEIYNINLNLNPRLEKRIQLIRHPVSNKSDQIIYFENNGPGSKMLDTPFETQTGSTETISIDDFVQRYNVSQIDFIKMDIEGAEPAALKGALNTIKKFRPKLAIAIYHSLEDFVNIPKWLMELDLDYEFYLGHYTIHAEETVIYANPINR